MQKITKKKKNRLKMKLVKFKGICLIFRSELPEDYRKVTLTITVMDKETMRKDLVVGTVSIPLSSLREKEEKNEWYPIVLKEKAKEQASLHISLLVDSKVLYKREKK